jgi:hypothetical protein
MFGKSLFDESELQWMIKNRMLEKTDVRLPTQNEKIPRPEPDECVVFRDYFAAGLRMPCQDFVEEILKAYNIEMHHLTLFMRCILNFGVKWLMEKVSSNILDVAVLSQLVVLNR